MMASPVADPPAATMVSGLFSTPVSPSVRPDAVSPAPAAPPMAAATRATLRACSQLRRIGNANGNSPALITHSMEGSLAWMARAMASYLAT